MRVEAFGVIADDEEMTAVFGAKELCLGPQSVRVLAHLMNNRDVCVTADELLAALWDKAPRSGSQTARSRVMHIRRALESNGCYLLHTVRGEGYVFSGDVESVRQRYADKREQRKRQRRREWMREKRRGRKLCQQVREEDALVDADDIVAHGAHFQDGATLIEYPGPFYALGANEVAELDGERVWAGFESGGVDCQHQLSAVREYPIKLGEAAWLADGELPFDVLGLPLRCRALAALHWATDSMLADGAVVLYRRVGRDVIGAKVYFEEDAEYRFVRVTVEREGL